MKKRKSFLIYFLVFVLVISSGCVFKTQSGLKVETQSQKAVNRAIISTGRTNNGTRKPVGRMPTHAVDENAKALCVNASQPLDIHTYDGSNQANHPKVLYFDTPWHQWKYWMSYTPYPDGNANFENPSIAVSNDGVNWVTPVSLMNPLIKQPADVGKGGHYSDPHLVMDGQTMELWYRYNPAKPDGSGSSNKINRIYMKTSTDGVDWSTSEMLLSDSSRYFSPAILLDSGTYKMWYSDSDGKLHYRQTSDLKNWSDPVTVDLVFPGHCIWHQDVIKTSSGYDIVFSSFKRGQFSKNNQCLYYASSADGIHFSTPVLLLAPSKGQGKLDNQMIYRSSIVDIDGNYKIYYSAMSHREKWHIFVTDFDPKSIAIS